ncbi:MAG: hypothetical protein GY737_13890 [Desulfobacteraceae bacterium]|nr:hypothetical protein [Desulfobacteraceae bacterium]
MIEKRRGIFTLDIRFMRSEPEVISKVMGNCVIWRAEAKYLSEQVVYEATSPQFDPIELGEMMPEYDVIVHRTGQMDGTETTIEFKRKEA